MLSNDLDEYTIKSIRDQGAPVSSWGVGTKLATAYDQPSLGGVYKLSATKDRADAAWSARLKVSEQSSKLTLPGVLDVRRYRFVDGRLAGDMVFDVNESISEREIIIDPADILRRKELAGLACETLLAPLARGGVSVLPAEERSAMAARERTSEGLAHLDESQKRFLNPHSYPVGLEEGLWHRRADMAADLRAACAVHARNIGFKAAIVDSYSTGWDQAYCVLAALEAVKAGCTLEQSARAAADAVGRTRFLFAPTNLTFLQKGGRIGAAKALLGNLVHIVPVLTVRDGLPVDIAKARTQKKAIAQAFDRFKADVESKGLKDAVVHYIGSPDDAIEWARSKVEPFLGRSVRVLPVSPVVGLHVGPDMLAIVFWGKDRREDLSVSDRIARKVKGA